jgi:redox-sensitive bicupin YhaK (pirin superfamily)
MMLKSVTALHAAQRDDIGDLVTRRPLPGPRLAQVDPFLFLNHHGPQIYPPNNRGLPFGPHPHRGFETVTFILDGELMHRDSAGYESVIRAGGVQWMTAGAGIVHAELSPESFRRAGGPMEILQLWVNLPARLKMSPPNYQGVQAGAIPQIAAADGLATVNLIAGEWRSAKGPVQSLTGVFMTMIRLRPGAVVAFDNMERRNVFLYVVRGDVQVNGVHAGAHHLVEMSSTGDAVTMQASGDAVLLFGHAAAINEPVASYGPFVMNTESEIRAAIADYQSGKMGFVAE